ncbi:Hsp20/alpha crystallin family protein [Agromyces bauzanensis]
MAGSLSRFDPFAELSALQKQLFSDGLFGQARRQLPTTDIYTEDDSKLTVEAHLPGFAQDDIEINVDEGALVVRAEKHEKEEDKGKKYVVRESSSSYYRRIQLPEQADQDAVTASFDKGVLRVTVPYKELPSPRKISINQGGGAAASGGGATTTGEGTAAT